MYGNYFYYSSANNLASSNSPIANTTLGLWVANGGSVHVQFGMPMRNSEANQHTWFANAVFNNVANGTLLPIRVNIIYTDSTANGFVGLF